MLFIIVLVPLLVVASTICLLPALFQLFKKKGSGAADAQFNKLQRTYLIVFAFAVGGDWLQGAHLYDLYENAGIAKSWIEWLFLFGFLSSLLFGTVIGSLADKLGRKKIAIVYAVFYIITCATANFSKIWIFAIGRICGGIATSILFSAFESWAVHENAERGFEESQLSVLFSNAGLLNSAVAVIGGIAAQKAVDFFGSAAPFNLAIMDLLIMIALISCLWNENYGNQELSVAGNWKGAMRSIFSDASVLCLGLVQSLFEGCMYTFIVQWTPALKTAFSPRELDHGYIFATFMVAVSIGSSCFKFISKVLNPEKILCLVFLLGSACMAAPLIFPKNAALIYGSFILFEFCVGVFWPAMGTMRGVYLPEEGRSTIMNIFRIPLNIIVIAMMVADFKLQTTFIICTVLLFVAALIQVFLVSRAARYHQPQHHEVPMDVKYAAVPQIPVEEKKNGLLENGKDEKLGLSMIDEEETQPDDLPVPPASPTSVAAEEDMKPRE